MQYTEGNHIITRMDNFLAFIKRTIPPQLYNPNSLNITEANFTNSQDNFSHSYTVIGKDENRIWLRTDELMKWYSVLGNTPVHAISKLNVVYIMDSPKSEVYYVFIRIEY